MGEVIRGQMSKVQGVTLPEEQFRSLGIAGEASMFSFSYPLVTAQELQVSDKDIMVPDIAFLVFGGFMYFDSDMVLQDIRAVMPSETGRLRFSAAQAWQQEWTTALATDRWNPVTIPALRSQGVRYFSWLLPGERVEGRDLPLSRNGGFVYIFHEPSEVGTLQAKLDVYFEIEEEDAAPAGRSCAK